LRLKFFLPVIAHSSRSYDSHFLIRCLNQIQLETISVIPQNTEKYTAIIIDKLVFLDSFLFLNASLSVLANNLPLNKFIRTKSCFPLNYELLTKKGFFPYDYLDDFDKFKEKHLPKKDYFFNALTDSSISDDNYDHCKNVWKKFNCKSFGDYHDIYLLSDCLILADIFENFRIMALEYFKLDPCHFFTLPMFSWTAALKFTNISLELFTDYDKYLFIENSIRGGISVASQRYAKANNKYLNNFDSNKDSSFITYLDANSLYSTAMCEYLPVNNFKWLSQKEITFFNISKIKNESNIGFILEVDLSYPDYLHDLHNDYPLCPEHFDVDLNMLSKNQKDALSLLNPFKNLNSAYKNNKLIPNLYNKNKYIIHSRHLKLVKELGLKVDKIYRILSFNQSKWLKPYIDFTVNQRKQAENDFAKDFFKLMNNSVFGKTMENQRNRIIIKIIMNDKQLLKVTKQPTLETFTIIDKDLALCKMKKTTLNINKPIYIGFTVLELSKVLMYNFYYNVLKKLYPQNNQLTLLYTDTDSFILKILTKDIFKDFEKISHLMDFSDYPSNHTLFSNNNKKENGKFKDEAKSEIIEEFIALKSKMYSIKYASGYIKKAAKGIKKNVAENKLRHEMYHDALFLKNHYLTEQMHIISKDHEIFTQKVLKLSLHAFDDKRFILNNNIETKAFGHYKIL